MKRVASIKAKDAQDVAFAKKQGLSISDMARSGWVYKRLRNFRAGVEGISLVPEADVRIDPLHLEDAAVVPGLRLEFGGGLQPVDHGPAPDHLKAATAFCCPLPGQGAPASAL